MTDENEMLLGAYRAYEATREAMTEDLELALKKISQSTKTYTFKSRLKPAPTIQRKVLRKRQEGRTLKARLDAKPLEATEEDMSRAQKLLDYGPEHVTDIYGFRYVTLYQSDIPVIVAELLQGLEEFNDRLHRGDEPIRPVEFVIYTNRPLGDPLSIVSRTVEIVRQSSFAKLVEEKNIRPPESRKSAYSSVHFVFARSTFPGPRKSEEIVAKLEIQIRDIFEEGWGEVQHHLLYSDKDKQPGEAGDQATAIAQEDWELQLNALKTFVDGCSQHASIIKRTLEQLHAVATPTALTNSVSQLDADREEVQVALRRRNAPPRAMDAVTLGYGLLLSDDPSSDADTRIANLTEAASAFDKAMTALNDETMKHPTTLPSGRSIGFHLKMEAASARAQAAGVAAERAVDRQLDEANRNRLASIAMRFRAEARTLYESVAAAEPDDPVAAMRLGKLLSGEPATRDDLEKSIRHFDAAIALVPKDDATGPEHWISISLHIDRGLALWRLAQFGATPEQRDAGLAETVAETLLGYRVWNGQGAKLKEPNKITGHKAASNAIYFMAERASGGHVLSEEEKALVSELITHVEGAKIDKYSDYFKTTDNVMHGYLALRNIAKARSLAFENYTTLRKIAEDRAGGPLDGREIETHLFGSPLRCFRAAQATLALE